MNRRAFLSTAGAGALGAGAAALGLRRLAQAQQAAARRPNVIFILIDDLGWRDLGCYGSTFYQTPHTDRLASQGMRFTDAYAACPVCSPTRASILTGKYPARLHLTDWISGHRRPWARLAIPNWRQYLRLEEVTLAEALKAAGYVTGHFGKWHLGGPRYRPEVQGFDVNFGGDHRGAPPSYFYPYRIPIIRDGRPGEYLTDRTTDEVLRFIDANRQRPFFIYLSHYAVHTPLQAPRELVEQYRRRIRPGQRQRNATYAAMVHSVDQSVGRVLAKLDEHHLADHTIIFFMSDNGGLARVTSNHPLRAGKGTPYEGGIREPMIVKWPGVVQPGSTCSVPVTSVDFYPTILEMAGVRGDPSHRVDGLSFVSLLRQSGTLPDRAIFWHYPHYHPGGATPFGALRRGRHKLIEFYEDNHLELYDLRTDIGEQHNLAERMPALARELRQALANWRREVNAQMPTLNPNYDPARARQRPRRRRAPPGKQPPRPRTTPSR